MDHDAIVVGGSYAGMSAALQLLRARRSVLVIDGGQRRNRFASHSHGFLGQDGADPGAIAKSARGQLEAYPSLTWIDGQARALVGERDRFLVSLLDGSSHRGRRVILAIGVSDRLPPIEGLAERWGASIFHCPYCHGYELDRGRVGVIATGPMSTHQAELLTEWGDVTFFTNGAVELDQPARAQLRARGVTIEETTIGRITGVAEIILSDGRGSDFAGLFVAPRCEPSGPLAISVGCALDETPMGLQIRTDAAKHTSVPGVFACGDVARVPHSVSLAVADGAWAGAQVHRSLVWPDG